MISLSTRVDKKGFWYLIEAEDCSFGASYIVIGTGGRQGSGEIRGSSANTRGWQYVEIGFPVLQVGITDLQIAPPMPEGSQLARPNPPQVEPLSRRKAIRTLATTLLSGGALLMLGESSSFGQAMAGGIKVGSQPLDFPGDPTDRYNPYNDERDSYRPY